MIAKVKRIHSHGNTSTWTSRQYVLNIYSCNNAYADVFQNDFG